jgi:hypothetical protein
MLASSAGCGEEKTFTGPEFADRIAEQGVAIHLGRRLHSSGDADQLFAVSLSRLRGEPPPRPDAEGGGGASGTLYVFGDDGGAEDQLQACRASGGLICFRAANVVVVLDEEAGGIQAQRLGVAIERLSSE